MSGDSSVLGVLGLGNIRPLLKSNAWSGGKLVPYLCLCGTFALYFVLFIPEDKPSWGATTIKCLPILSLALFVLLHGITQQKFSQRILMGLLFSCVGDAFLIWPGYFLHGTASFGVAQVFYIRAFGFEPLRLKLGAIIYAHCGLVLLLIGPSLLNEPWPLCVGCILYSSLLICMAWRAAARLSQGFAWSAFFGVVGAASFVISDSVLSINRFYAPIPHHQVIIMLTYYFAQLALTLTIVTPRLKDN